jgi:hypothetical protein
VLKSAFSSRIRVERPGRRKRPTSRSPGALSGAARARTVGSQKGNAALHNLGHTVERLPLPR